MNAQCNLPELLVPAGNPKKLRSALLYGANAVYLGGSTFNLRAAADGFDKNELAEAVRDAEAASAKVYYCLNSLPQQKDIAALPAQIEEAAQCGVHAFIIADPGVLRLARRYAPSIPVHLSTQANNTNSEAVNFWLEQGISRVNLARELTHEDIGEIRRACPGAELEVFVQGAICLAVSGQCLLSAWLNQRPANAGRCTQPCRFEYRAIAAEGFNGVTPTLRVDERTRPGEELWSIHEGESYSSFWAPHDLCLLPWLPWFLSREITAIKVEGRTKSSAYVAHMADVYSSALQELATTGPDNFDPEPYLLELLYISSRPLGSGFFMGDNRRILSEELYDKLGGKIPQRPVIARVLENTGSGRWSIEAQGNWEENEEAELMLPGLKRPRLRPNSYTLLNHKNEAHTRAACGTLATLLCDEPEIKPGIFIRKVVE